MKNRVWSSGPHISNTYTHVINQMSKVPSDLLEGLGWPKIHLSLLQLVAGFPLSQRQREKSLITSVPFITQKKCFLNISSLKLQV